MHRQPRDGREQPSPHRKTPGAVCARGSAALAAAWLAAAAGPAAAQGQSLPASPAAQDYPNREIRSICNFAAGSGADILVRFFSDQLSRRAGKPVLVENRPGAQGALATEATAKARPDGYTINITAPGSTLAMAPHLFKQLNFDPVKDFAAVTTVARLSFAIAVDASRPIRSIAELVEFLKKKPGHGAYGTGSNSGQVTGEVFKDMAGLTTQYVNYKASVQAVTDLLGGQTDFIAYDMTFLAGQMRAGRVRVLALSSAQRSGTFPDIPTMAELGYAGFDITPWWGVIVPAGTPRPIIDRLNAEVVKIMQDPESTALFERARLLVVANKPDEFAAMIKAGHAAWGEVIRLTGITGEGQ